MGVVVGTAVPAIFDRPKSWKTFMNPFTRKARRALLVALGAAAATFSPGLATTSADESSLQQPLAMIDSDNVAVQQIDCVPANYRFDEEAGAQGGAEDSGDGEGEELTIEEKFAVIGKTFDGFEEDLGRPERAVG